jgi:outer membrane protein insertion porin family
MEDVLIVYKYLAAIVVLTLLFLSVFTISSAADDIKVTLLQVEGNKRIETSTILAKIKTKEGDVFSPSVVREDIKVLYQLGHFEDVQVRTEGFENGLKVIFSVKEKPLIREITFEGNNEYSSDKLKEGLTLLPRTAFNMQLINDNADKIRLKYQDDGFYDAVVVPVVTELRSGDRNVVFTIEEGHKVRLDEVIISGNKALSSQTIKDALKNQEHHFYYLFGHSGTLRKEELKDDLDTIRNLYYNNGYIQVIVDEPIIEPKTHTFRECYFWGPYKTFTRKSELVMRINIKEGDQFRVGSLTVKGNTLLSEEELSKEIKLKKGDIFNRDMLRQDVGRIMDRYDSIARPFANVIPQFNIDQDNKSVAIQIEIQEGGEVRIGRIDITGNNKTRDKVIRRQMRLAEGDLYSKKALKRSYERMNNLNYFDTVEIIPDRRLQEPIMDLNVRVKEKLTGTFSIGGGYSSVDKLMGIAEITQGNLGGRGQQLKFKVQWGSTQQLFMLSFLEPYLFDKEVYGKIDLYNQQQDYDGYNLKTSGLSLGVGKSFGEYVSSSLKFSYDNSLVTDITSTAPYTLQKQLNSYGDRIITNALSWSLARDSRDFFLDPKTGSRNSVFVEYAGGPLGGDPNFLKTIGDSAWYFPVFWDTVIMFRGRYGYVESLIDKPVPLGERFYVGGPSTLRGFRYGSAGPMDAELNRLGGTKELIYNIEYTFPIVPAARLKGVLFYDIGKAFDDHETVKASELRQTVGFGFWWFSPIGPLRFEWGSIVDRKPDDQASKFDFSIGTLC